MEIYQLKVFLAVARQLSFTEAANELNLTQPAVSAKIKSLEANLGTTLFHRLGRKIELTAAGDYLLEVGPGLIDLEGRLIKGIEEIKQGKLNQLTLGCTPNVASGWLPKILFAYRQKYPQVDLQCFSFETVPEIYQAIAAGDIDVAFSEALSTGDSDADNKASFAEIEAVPVDKFQYTLVVAADHRLAAREWLSLRDLTEEVWALPGESTPNWMALAGRLSELGLQLSDFPNREIVEFPSLMSPFLSQGHYLGFASSFQFQTERKARLLTAISLQEFPLDFELFMLTSNSKKPCAHQPSSGSSQKPLQQLIQLIQERTGYGSHQQQNFSAKGKKTEVPAQGMPKLPVHWQMPTHGGTQNHRYSGAASKPGTLTIAIGTQNRTIQTVTAGLIIQRLGLLEHFLPRQGRYQNANYQIQWRDFTSGAPIVAGLHSDQLDLGILGDYPLLLSGLSSTETTSPSNAAESPNLKTQLAKTRLVSFVASNPDGTGNTVIVPNRSLMTSLDDFRDRVIAVPFASAAHGMIMRSLARADLLPEVTLTAIDNLSIHRLTPRNSLADGYAYFAPLHDIASHKGQFRRLLEGDPEQLLPTFHGVVVREAFADAHPELVIAYLKALIAAQYWYETTPSALSLVSNWVGLAPEIVAKTLAYQRSEGTGLFFPDTKIRTDWVAEHIQQLSTIAGNEALGDLNLDTWIQPGLLETALSTL